MIEEISIPLIPQNGNKMSTQEPWAKGDIMQTISKPKQVHH
jgi:hypothetical protein